MMNYSLDSGLKVESHKNSAVLTKSLGMIISETREHVSFLSKEKKGMHLLSAEIFKLKSKLF